MDKNNGFVVPFSEKISYGMGMLGTNLTYGLVTGYVIIYFTDVFMIAPVAIAALILIARLWDAVNDPVMGLITDRTRTKWGKFRPYILLSALVLPLFTYLLFSSPNLSGSSKIVFAFVTYIGWGMAYTVADIPKWSIVSVMSDKKQERVSIISIAKVFGMIGSIGLNIAVIPLVIAIGKGNEVVGYRAVGLIIAVLVCIATLLMFFTVKERVTPNAQIPKLKDSARAIFRNKPLLMLMTSKFIIRAVLMIGMSLNIHYVKYNLGNELLVPIITMVSLFPILLGAGVAGKLTKKLGNKKTYIISVLGMVLRGITMFFVGYSNVPVLIGLMAFGGFFIGLSSVVGVAMLTDTIDYTERRTGMRNEGTIFSTQTFIVKLSGAFGGSIAVLALGMTGYVAGAVQSTTTLNWMHALITIIPAFVTIFALVPIYFYNTDGTQKPAIKTSI